MSKQKEELKTLRETDAEALLSKGKDFEEELLKLRFRAAAGQLEHTAQLKELKRSVARVKTILAEKSAEKSKEAA